MFRLLQRLGYTQILRLSNGFGFTMNPRLTPATAASSCIPADAWQNTAGLAWDKPGYDGLMEVQNQSEMLFEVGSCRNL